ncbi:uncharacterized protein LOC135126989 isoform X2 [Zophobas morio]|uniref:uncharacterized protein LOC135126989 isoform X2 n=1 Tax=Zophobas morio TaxID=2755281 RepID=UPI0030832EE7
MEAKGSTNIQVAIRMRPLINTEEVKKLRAQWGSQNNLIYQIDDNGLRHQLGEVYSFDHIFGTDKTNLDIYNDIVKDFVVSSLSGLNSTIFAYGQTSSGKTYTMLGDKTNMGIMTLAIENIFKMVENNKQRKYLLRVSYMEIYNEKINDLLDLNNKDVKIREFFPCTIGLQNIKEELVTNKEQMYECLKTGNLNRHISATKANDRSSRSHTIFKIVIESTETGDSGGCIQISNLNLVDLAGSERVAQTKATGMRLKEGGHINKSLSALSLVIKQLSDGQEFVNFRDSKLTRLLQDSLGGNSKTLIIATITLASVEDTNSTLAFAQRAKTVKNKPRVNEILTETDVTKRNAVLTAELQKKLKEQMIINQNFQKTEEEYFKKISNLQQQVKMLEDFQGAHTTEVKTVPKRRHTIGFSAQKKIISRLPLDDLEKSCNDSAEITLFEDLLKRDPPSTVCKLSTIREEDPLPSTFSTPSKFAIPRKFSTPENCLRMRLSSLEEEYHELASFTRNENNIFNETAKKADALEQQLAEAQKKLQDFEIKELELQTKIKCLEDQLGKNEDVDDPPLTDIMDELIRLQEILNNPRIFDASEYPPQENSVLQVIKKFNIKAKTSKDIIETEILKQINNFDNNSPDLIKFPSELKSFNDLLNQLSLFESDLPADVINLKKDTVEDVKVLIKIYESFLRKNETIRQYAEKIKNLEQNNKRTNLESEKSELADLSETHSNYALLKEEFEDKIKENESLLQQLDHLKMLMETTKNDANMLSDQLNEKNTKLLEVETNYILLAQENEELKQKYNSENTSLTDELTKLRKDVLESNDIIDKISKNCTTLEGEKLKLQHQIANTAKENEVDKGNLEMDQLRILIKTMTYDADALNATLIEKNNKILEIEKNCTSLTQENEELKQKWNNTCSENPNLTDELNKLKKDVLESNNTIEQVNKNYAILEEEKEYISKEMDKLRMLIKTMTDDTDMLNAKLSEKNNKILEIEENCTSLTQQTEELKQKLNNAFSENANLTDELNQLRKNAEDSDNTSLIRENEELKLELNNALSENANLADELNKLKEEFLGSQNTIDELTKNSMLIENAKLQLEQQITSHGKEKENFVKEIDRIKLVVDSQNRELHNFTLSVLEKNKVIADVENNLTKLKHEKEKLEKEMCAISDNNQYLKQEIQRMKSDNSSDDLKIKNHRNEILTVKLEEKDKVIREIETKNSKLVLDLEDFKRKFENTVSENENLKEEIRKVTSDREFDCEKIKNLQNSVNTITTEIESKNFTLVKLENEHTSLTQEVKKLMQTNSEKDKVIREIRNNNKRISSEMQNVREKLKAADTQNQHLKTEIESLKKNDKIFLEAQEKCRHLQLEAELATEKVNEILVMKEQLTNEIENLKKTVQEHRHVISSTEQKLNQSEQRVQKYKQLLEIAHTEINDLKVVLSDKEKLKCQISDYRCQLNVTNSKLHESTKVNQDLTIQLKHLQMTANGCDKSYNKNCEEKGELSVLDLRRTKKELEDVLCRIIEQVISEQKTLLLYRQSQDRRDDFKNVIRDVKLANAVLKNQFQLLRNQKEYDLHGISDNLLKSRSSFQQYINLEKTFLQKQIDELNSTNESYLQEIIALKDSQKGISMKNCFQCTLLQAEVAKLRELPATQEKMLSSLKDKNKILEKENFERVQQVVALQVQMFEEQDKKVEMEYTRWLKFYRENAKTQQREIETLKRELQQYQKTKENKISPEVQCNIQTKESERSAEVQCNILQEESHLQIKYNMMKQICIQRKDEIAALKSEILVLKNNRNTDMQDSSPNKENAVEKTSVGVQCDLFSGKYNLTKKLAQMRRTEILELQAELQALKTQNSVTKS